MVEEIKIIMQILADTIKVSGELALFGLAGYAVFKLLTLASYIVLARYVAKRFFDWLNAPSNSPIGIPRAIDKNTEAGIHAQLLRLQGDTSYLHYSDVRILKEALDKVLVV